MCLNSPVLNASACVEGADMRCPYLMPAGHVCISTTLFIIAVTLAVVPSLLLSMLPVYVPTQTVPLQLTEKLPAFMSTITSLVEMELEANKVHPAAVLNVAPVHVHMNSLAYALHTSSSELGSLHACWSQLPC